MHKEWDEGAVFAVRLFDYDTRRSTEGTKADVLSHAADVRKNTYHTHSYVHSMYTLLEMWCDDHTVNWCEQSATGVTPLLSVNHFSV